MNAASHLWSTPQTCEISINAEGQEPCPPTPMLGAARPLLQAVGDNGRWAQLNKGSILVQALQLLTAG